MRTPFLMMSIVLGTTLESTTLAAPPFVEEFTSNRNANWSVYETNGTAFNPGPGNSGPAPFASANANGGTFTVPIPSFDGNTSTAGAYGNGLRAVALNNENNDDGGFWQSQSGTNAIYQGGLLGNLNNPNWAIDVKYKLVVSGTYQPYKYQLDGNNNVTGIIPDGSPVTVNPGDPLTRSMFYAGRYTLPVQGDPGQYGEFPEEVRMSLYLRRYDPAVVGDTTSESTRWFNEAQSNRMLFPAPGSTGLLNGVYTDMFVPLNAASGLWENYWGYGNAAGVTWGGPIGSAASNFQYTLSDVQQLRLQVDSSYFGANGTALAPGLTGSLIIDSISLVFVPEPASLTLFALGGLAVLHRRRAKRLPQA